MITWIEKLSVLLDRFLMFLAGIAVVALMAVAALNVISRMFGKPFTGAYETVGFLGALVIAFALGETQRRKDHIVVDILSSRFPKRVNRVLDTLQYVFTVAFFGAITWRLFIYAGEIGASHEVSETLKIPYYPLVYCVSVGFATLTLNLILDLLKTIVRGQETEA